MPTRTLPHPSPPQRAESKLPSQNPGPVAASFFAGPGSACLPQRDGLIFWTFLGISSARQAFMDTGRRCFPWLPVFFSPCRPWRGPDVGSGGCGGLSPTWADMTRASPWQEEVLSWCPGTHCSLHDGCSLVPPTWGHLCRTSAPLLGPRGASDTLRRSQCRYLFRRVSGFLAFSGPALTPRTQGRGLCSLGSRLELSGVLGLPLLSAYLPSYVPSSGARCPAGSHQQIARGRGRSAYASPSLLPRSCE